MSIAPVPSPAPWATRQFIYFKGQFHTNAGTGEDYKTQSIAALWGARNIPIECEDTDALPSLTGAVHYIAKAQSPTSAGGAKVTHSELLEMLPELRAAQAAINSLLVRAERIAA